MKNWKVPGSNPDRRSARWWFLRWNCTNPVIKHRVSEAVPSRMVKVGHGKITKFSWRGFWNFVWRSSHTFKRDISKIKQIWKSAHKMQLNIGGWAKLSKLEEPISSKTVRLAELKLSSFSYFNDKINWWFSPRRLFFMYRMTLNDIFSRLQCDVMLLCIEQWCSYFGLTRQFGEWQKDK